MRTLHIAPSDSAGGSIRFALRNAGRDDEVLACMDDLSCGPIDPSDGQTRADWWGQYYDDVTADGFDGFWHRVSTASEPVVVWYSPLRASELTLFLAVAERREDLGYRAIDVAGALPKQRTDGSFYSRSAGTLSEDEIAPLLGTERALASHERSARPNCGGS